MVAWSAAKGPLFAHAGGRDARAEKAGIESDQLIRITHDATLALARPLVARIPAMTLCYVSGAGADSTEKGRVMWARVKGKTENQLLRVGFKAVYLFRPGYIQPLRGIRSRTRLYRALYTVAAPLYPLWKTLFTNQVTTTTAVGRAMIHVAVNGHDRPVLETRHINAVAARAGA
ncbi:MAG: hypothetical protein L0271_28145 [Gemmatimonadetes bacterium]|nr:hypothetical protein [Gemmatimonadota bacterium]